VRAAEPTVSSAARDPFTPAALGVLAVALLGMAYCHMKDVGMKFDEHVYYMAYLFCTNIAASVALAAFAVACYMFGAVRWLRGTLLAIVALGAVTIGCFLWSRTAGFPQMADHIGEWDSLGIASLVFEAVAVLLAGALVLQVGRRPAAARSAIALAAITALVGAGTAFAAGPPAHEHEMHDHGMKMHGNTAEYPDLGSASAVNARTVRRLHQRTVAAASRFDTPAKARHHRYTLGPRRQRCPGIVHYRKGGAAFWGKMLDPNAPQALVEWCDSHHALTLIGFMYRAPGDRMPPTYGDLLGWHKHGMDATWMTHVWLTAGTRESLATCVPFNALTSKVTYTRYVPDVHGDQPCSDTKAARAP
jgi:hypothetical protein